MQKTKFTESQIVATIKKQESGISTKEIAVILGIIEATFYNWKAKYGGMEVSDVKKMKDMEAESAGIRRLLRNLLSRTTRSNRYLKKSSKAC